MPKTQISEYSATAASNTDIDSINLSEGVMVPSDINNAIREQMAHLKDFSDGTAGIDVLNLHDDDKSHSIKIQAPSSVTANTTLTLPDGAGSANQVLQTNGAGVLSWGSAVNFGNWTITMDGSNNLLFTYSGTDAMKLSSAGDLTVIGNVTAYGTI
tara:strand:- start:489 stop:956 length:468 start_codon:yes stop_codon:yes gene_type:complete